MQREILAGAVAELHAGEALDQAAKLLQRTLEIREMGSQGVHKTAIREFLARIGRLPIEYRSHTRIDMLATLERDLASMKIDHADELRLLQAWLRGCINRHGEDKTADLKAIIAEAEEALGEIETAELAA